MTGLLDGATVPWHFVSGKTEPGTQPDPLVLERVRARRAATAQLPPPVTREPQKRLIAGGLFIAAALAEQMRRLK